jgi:TIR domain
LGAHGKVFVSYRREDAPGDARSIYDRLCRSFGEGNVFMDVDRLLAGQRFDLELDKALAKCDVLIAVIGSRWMDLLSEYARHGRRDYVRDEIAAALQRDIIVIPVMMGREANMPPLPLAEDLPENIRDLVLYQKHNIAHESFGRDAAHLIAALKSLLRERRGARPWPAIAVTGVIGLAVTGVLLGYRMGTIPRIESSIAQRGAGMNDSKVVALLRSDAASKKAEEEVRKKAETEAKAAADAAKTKAANDAADIAKKPLGDQANALKLITDTADRICDLVTAGSSRGFDVEGQLKAELGGLASRLASAGISSSGKPNEEQYQNVLRQDLAETLRDNSTCKLKVFETLSKVSSAPAMEPALNITGSWRDNRGIMYNIAQEGDAFRFSAFGSSCRGNYFETSGRGTISGHHVESSYSSSLPSEGKCSGTILVKGTEMSSYCNDTICGAFSAYLFRQ